MKFIQLEDKTGRPLVLNLDQIQYIDCSTQCVVTDGGEFGGRLHLTKESCDKIMAAISSEMAWF